MIEREIIIVGGGPAGSSCAWELQKAGKDCLILDKEDFPRTKLCAGWITPSVVKTLRLKEEGYPHPLLPLPALHFRFKGRKFKLKTLQYSIRRYELDAWLLERSGAEFQRHKIQKIEKKDDFFIIDNKFRCKILVGAGGTNCPVYRTFFQELAPRKQEDLIVTQEKEFPLAYKDKNCYLWFLENGLPGYSWYVPKGKGFINIGIGGAQSSLKKQGDKIRDQWRYLSGRLQKLGLADLEGIQPKGHSYYLRQKARCVQQGNAYIAGDAVGLATVDMGEGIGPAVQSGLRVAKSILTGKPYSVRGIGRFSFLELLRGRFLKAASIE